MTTPFFSRRESTMRTRVTSIDQLTPGAFFIVHPNDEYPEKNAPYGGMLLDPAIVDDCVWYVKLGWRGQVQGRSYVRQGDLGIAPYPHSGEMNRYFVTTIVTSVEEFVEVLNEYRDRFARAINAAKPSTDKPKFDLGTWEDQDRLSN